MDYRTFAIMIIISGYGRVVMVIVPTFEVIPAVHVEFWPANVPISAVISPPAESNPFAGFPENWMGPIKVKFSLHVLSFSKNFLKYKYPCIRLI